MLALRHVSKRFREQTVLDDIDLTFGEGVYGLLAPNGAGKTTLMKMIATLLYPTTGSIQWNGEDIIAMDERYRGLLGYLPQDFGYYPNYTPRQFLRYVAALQGIRRSRVDKRIDRMLAMVGLTAMADRRMRSLSGGMIQRVGIAQAIIHDPQLLILDEPTAGLDPKERVRFRNLIHDLAVRRTVILSTHIVSDLETIAGSVIMIRGGHIIANGTPTDICTTLMGHIYEMPASDPLPDGCRLLSEVQYGAFTRQRVYSPTRLPGVTAFPSVTELASATTTVQPNLEDAFLIAYGD
ncbi:ABC transporter, ATP-binding protein [Bifidobacterium margollesii]|uniref:ABC transporter, ATP-binding protein n=1 Tax=Bifidobacterium margollesii TaxID=2020964 RepID=A0A2N5J806_9BIFI|nr:ABC transporter ATP-binding protein [Bifidobacterium margollesii]PLS30321.1 ABC transporter, ATP-binding protein [Bifidobacterium margollesii]